MLYAVVWKADEKASLPNDESGEQKAKAESKSLETRLRYWSIIVRLQGSESIA
jgi:hypothetical protein